MTNKIFDSTLRMQILTLLSVKRSASFAELKKAINASDGNLSGHLLKLEKANFIKIEKKFIGRKPKTTYRLTETGKKEFVSYLIKIEKILKTLKEAKNE